MAVDISMAPGIVFESPLVYSGFTNNDSIEGADRADVDNDGDNDLVVGHGRNSGFSVAFADGNGSYAVKQHKVNTAQPIRLIKTADLNNDGLVDVIASGESMVFTYLGTGENGTWNGFELASTLRTPTNSIDLGDVNNDGQLDLLLARDHAVVYTGMSDGTFSNPIRYATASPQDWRKGLFADVDHDNDLDLVTIDQFDVTVLRNDAGIFESPIDAFKFPSLSWTSTVTVADVDADGLSDILLGDSGLEESHVFLHRGMPDGTFNRDGLRFETLGPAADIQTADMNGDGRLDLVVGHRGTFHHPINNNGPGGVSILLANETGSFHEAVRITTPDANRVFVEDINADALPDIVATQYNEIKTFLQSSANDFERSILKVAPVDSFNSFNGLGDLNQDGVTDYVVASSGFRQVEYNLDVLVGAADGSFHDLNVSLSNRPTYVQVANFDSDEALEIAVVVSSAFNSELLLFELDDQSELKEPVRTALRGQWTFYDSLDLGGDGITDFLAFDSQANALRSVFGTPSGEFELGAPISTSTGYGVVVADFNNDSNVDLALRESENLVVRLGNGDGTFSQSFSTRFSPSIIRVGDFNGDQNLDLAYTDFRTEDVLIRLGDGQGEFGDTSRTPKVQYDFFTADFDDDGLTDLLFAGYLEMIPYRSTGDGFQETVARTVPHSIANVLVHDIDRDGSNEILILPGASIEIPQAQLTVIDSAKTVTYSFSANVLGTAELVDVGNDGRQDLVVGSYGGFFVLQQAGPSSDGDFNQDGQIDGNDVDWLCQAISGGNASREFDLDSNGQVDAADIDFAVESIFDSVVGDVNFDGVFNSSDLVKIFQAGEYEDDLPRNSKWTTGDWNCDGDFTTADLVYAFRKSGFTAEAKTEPNL